MDIKEAVAILGYQLNMKGTDVYTPINYEAIETVLTELDKKDKRISDLEFALMDMVLQFADENKDSINTMGLSALEIAFNELDFENPMSIKEVHKRYKELVQNYYQSIKKKVEEDFNEGDKV